MAANVIKYLMPAPNTGSSDSFQNNYAVNFPAPISSNQFDVRIDQNITPNQSIYGRFTWKNRSVDHGAGGELRWLLRHQPVAVAGRHRASRSRTGA